MIAVKKTLKEEGEKEATITPARTTGFPNSILS